jgi:hypothetical protein
MGARSKQKGKNTSPEAAAPSFNNPVNRLRWLVEFAQDQSEPNETLTIRMLVQGLGKYLDGVTLSNPAEDNEDLELSTYWDPEQSLDLPMGGEDSLKSWEDKLALVRSSVRKVLKDFLEAPQGVAFRLTAEVTQQRVWEEEQLKETLVAQDIREGLVFCLLQDLASAGKDLQRCPAEKCPRMFVKQYRQNFCSASCRHRTNFKAWYHRKKNDGTVTKPGQDKGEQLTATPPKKKPARSQKRKKEEPS